MHSLFLVLASALATASALAPVSSNLVLRGGGFSRKTFSLGSCLQDHFEIMKSIPVSVSVSHACAVVGSGVGALRDRWFVFAVMLRASQCVTTPASVAA